uniref:RING-type E3 ubiquitin transferase n=1 Tax=Strigamia maritima TaxID=126957 RepID=T1J1V5_STRMM
MEAGVDVLWFGVARKNELIDRTSFEHCWRMSTPDTLEPQSDLIERYLKEFRVEQCPLFLQHKCTQHRPFTCFYWHFMNQRRRRPIRKRDGTFNYNPDVYCTKYDETTGICPEGDDCPFLHRTAGDTERRYHLRYYKTGICVHDTDSRGYCVKNGPHCAFAHGAHDLRPPVYDIREIQAMEGQEDGTNLLDKERSQIVPNEDPKWQDTNYVLANYKTELCKKPPRLCRQGYACPQYHNNKDRRRSPRKYKYRSTPCPNVKHGDEWGDPINCENGDSCQYCHTRTEQQFHPEIYKSTKCNDIQQAGFCPRGAFCAFAHVDQEMTTQRDLPQPPDSSTNLATILSNVLPNTVANTSISNSNVQSSIIVSCVDDVSYTQAILPTPIGKPRSQSSSSISSETTSQVSYQKAPGSEREDKEANIRKQIQAIDGDPTLDPLEKAKRKTNLYLAHHLNAAAGHNSSLGSTVSPLATPFYPASDTVESVVGNALDDLNLDDINMSASIDKDLENDSNSVSSTISAGLANSALVSSGLLVGSAPVTIPGSSLIENRNHPLGHLSPPSSSPLSSIPPGFLPSQHLDQATASFLSQTKFGSFPSAGSIFDFSSQKMSPNNRGPQSPLVVNSMSENQRLRDELCANRMKFPPWDEGIAQSRNMCEAWKREAEEANRKKEMDNLKSSSFLFGMHRVSDLDALPLNKLKQLQHQLRNDLDKVDKIVYHRTAMKCMVCEEKNRCVALLPCNHYVLCNQCAPTQKECPYCRVQIVQRSSVVMPL